MLMAWERCREQTEPERALTLLTMAEPEETWERFATLPLAERNALLLELRALTFGRKMEGFAMCPGCGAQLEFLLDAAELRRGLRVPAPAVDAIAGRAVNTLDLLAIQEARDEAGARELLVARTLGMPGTDVASLPQAWLDRLDALNEPAEIRVQFQCAPCGGRPVLDFDIARYLSREVALAARRLLADIHALASAYGWSERAILTMSGARRAAYLEMLAA